jgi:hypothetical protein
MVHMPNRIRFVAWLSGALCSAPLLAHDLWIEPGTFSAAAEQVVSVRLRVGVDLKGDLLPLNPALVVQFVVVDSGGRRPVVARRGGADPAGMLRAAPAGLQTVGYQSHPSRIELGADKFNAYLLEEGLDAILDLRRQRNQLGSDAREWFSRCAKSLLVSNASDERDGDRVLGCPLELIAERNPYAPNRSHDFAVRLTFNGAPLAGALVVALNSQRPGVRLAVRSDSDGRARFALGTGGMWLVKAVHMVVAPPSADVDWQSYWASLTFEVREATVAESE